MTPLVIALVLGAAVLHASWNAVVRSGADRLWVVAVMSYATTPVALFFAVWLPLPRPAAWPLLAGSAVLQTAYIVFLAFAYRFVGAAQAGPFFGSKGDGSVSSDLFFSFVTLTTTGYGNLVPAKNPGQTMAVLEALLGQLFLVTAVAKVVNAWRPRGWQPSNPAVDPTSDAP